MDGGRGYGGILRGMNRAPYESPFCKSGVMLDSDIADRVMATSADKPEYDIVLRERSMRRSPVVGVASVLGGV